MKAVPAILFVLLGGATVADAEPPQGATLERPASVTVERLIGGDQTARRRGLLAWLVGSEAAAQNQQIVRPYSLAWDGDDLLIADPGAGRVLRATPRGRIHASSDRDFTGPIGVASCRFGVVVTDSRSGTVSLLDRELKLVRRIATGLERPSGVACDDAHVFVAETAAHRIVVLGVDGGGVGSFGRRGLGGGEFNFPAALALHGDSLWVGDTLNFRIQELRKRDGGFLRQFGRLGDSAGETPRVKGIAIDSAGRLWVSDAFLDQVAVFDGNGAFLGSLGRPGRAPGEFAFPAGIAIHQDGGVAVADSLNARIQVLRLTPPGSPASGGPK